VAYMLSRVKIKISARCQTTSRLDRQYLQKGASYRQTDKWRAVAAQTTRSRSKVLSIPYIAYVYYSWTRTRGAQLSAGYTVNTYSKPPMYDASKCGNVTRRSCGRSIYSADRQTRDRRQDLPPTNQPAKVTVPS